MWFDLDYYKFVIQLLKAHKEIQQVWSPVTVNNIPVSAGHIFSEVIASTGIVYTGHRLCAPSPIENRQDVLGCWELIFK